MINSDKIEIGMVGEGGSFRSPLKTSRDRPCRDGAKITKESDEQWTESRWWGLQVKH